jgi:sulfate transport system permease protein
LVVSGSIINSTETATVYIHDRFTDFQYAGAFAASLVLAAVSFLVLFIMQSLLKRRSREER